MKRYYLRVHLESPVSISAHENRDGQTMPSLDYIPGSTLRGALAGHWLREQPTIKNDEPRFAQLLDEGLWCGPLYPDDDETSKLAYRRDMRHLAQVVPATARTCKHQPGFASDDGEKIPARVGHGVQDILAGLVEEAALARWQSKPPDPPVQRVKGLDELIECGHDDCGSPLDRLPGYYEYVAQGTMGLPSRWLSTVQKRLVTRSAILPTLQSTAPANLYSREALEMGQHLAGWLWVGDGLEAWMQACLGEGQGGAVLKTGDVFYVGAARTAGFGQVRILDCRVDDSSYWATLAASRDARLDAFQNRLHPRVRSQWSFAPVSLFSDAILLDSLLRHGSALTPAVLKEYWRLHKRLTPVPLPLWPTGLELFVAVAHTRRIAGWNTGEGGKRPRTDDWAVAAGSVFVLATPPEQQQELRALCGWLEENGIGERREDGFGQVVVAHPFHNEEGVM